MASLSADRATIEILNKGDKKLAAFFVSLPDTMRRKHIRSAANKAGRVVIKEQRKRVPRSKRTGSTRLQSQQTSSRLSSRKDLFKAIEQRPSSKWDSKAALARGGIIGTAVGPRWPEGAVTHLIEFGHRLIAWGHRTGSRVKRQPFMRPAQRASRPRISSVFKTTLLAGLKKEAGKKGIKVT